MHAEIQGAYKQSRFSLTDFNRKRERQREHRRISPLEHLVYNIFLVCLFVVCFSVALKPHEPSKHETQSRNFLRAIRVCEQTSEKTERRAKTCTVSVHVTELMQEKSVYH